jgi:death-on-curing protein
MHLEMFREHGGAPGVRQGGEDLIESALARPTAPARLLAGVGFARARRSVSHRAGKEHGYVYGNNRVAFASAATFLRLNGSRLTASEPEAYDAVIGLVEGRYSEEQIAAWIRSQSESVR